MRDESQSDVIHFPPLNNFSPEHPQALPGPYSLSLSRCGVDDSWEILSRDGDCIAYYLFWDDMAASNPKASK